MSVETVVKSGRIRIGTRGSRLARWQSEWVADTLRKRHPGLVVELVTIKTRGDRDRNTPLATLGGAGIGIFTKEIQRALLDGTVEVAVHSLKDLPTIVPPNLILGAVPVREARTDALIAPAHRTLDALPGGARVGTSSLRRRALLRHARPDLVIEDLRGNVETRLGAAEEGRLDAVILAEAGLNRLGLAGAITQRLVPPVFLPAVGQGALGIECRADDETTRSLLASLDDPETHRAILAERACLAALGGGCSLPLGVWTHPARDEELRIEAAVLDPDGRERIDADAAGPAENPEALGRQLAGLLRQSGADRLLPVGPPPA